MANLRMSISLPEDLAVEFVQAISPKRRSRFVADLIKAKLRERGERDEHFARLCEAVNNDTDSQQVERDMASLPDTMDEEWHGTLTLPRTR